MAATPTPIAIVGMGCRFSGGASDPQKLWEMICDGRVGWSEVPESRYRWQSFYHPDHASQSAHNHRGGHFIDQDLAAFDAKFFGGMGQGEIENMDPCQRMLLELTYEAVENAGIRLEEDFQGSNTGVYVATFYNDYSRLQNRDPLEIAPSHATGSGQAILANRISYVFDLKGPSVVVDTACSGSMVALHFACQGLQQHEASTALVGAVNLTMDPDIMIPLSLQRFLNSDGRSYAFDSKGEGYGRGEGAAVLVLKRLEDALRDGDRIRAIIRNTGLGQDGKTAGITLPAADAQVSLIRSVYSRAGLEPRETTFVEAHGTGTVAGDYTEIEALSRAFSGIEQPLYVGSIKANVGHTESASGLAGLIKATLAVEKGMIPPNPKVNEIRPGMIPDGSLITISQKLQPWPPNRNHRVSVNSFGYGGTNGHALIEGLQSYLQSVSFNSALCQLRNLQPEIASSPSLIKVAHADENPQISCNLQDKDELSDCSHTLSPDTSISWLKAASPNPELSNSDFEREQGPTDGNSSSQRPDRSSHNSDGSSQDSPSTNTNDTSPELPPLKLDDAIDGRTESNEAHFLLPVTSKSQSSLDAACENVRRWVTESARSRSDLCDLSHTLSSRRSLFKCKRSLLARWSSANQAEMVEVKAQARDNSSSKPGMIFVFTGQGSQWFAMGRELLSTSSVFASSVQRSTVSLHQLGATWSLHEELCKNIKSSRLGDSSIGQPATTAVQIALVDLLRSIQIEPMAVVGHSSGEIAAAYAAGRLSSEAAIRVSYFRGFLAADSRKLTQTGGAMLAVGLGEIECAQYISRLTAGKVCVACSNSPVSTTLSGDTDAINELQQTLEKASVFTRLLKVDTAYHSHHMEAVADSYWAAMGPVVEEEEEEEEDETSNKARYFSSVTGEEKVSGFDASYWVQNLVSKVTFSDAIKNAYHQCVVRENMASPTIFLEIGPHKTLAGAVKQTLSPVVQHANDFACLPTLVRERHSIETLFESLGQLFEMNYPIDLANVNLLGYPSRTAKVVVDLHPYPWDHRTTYWREPRLSKEYRFRKYPYHDLLGLRTATSPPSEPVWRHRIGAEYLPWVQDHVVDQLAIFPASGFICMAIEAKRQITQDRGSPGEILRYVLKDVNISKPLVIPDAPGTVEMQIALRPMNRSIGQGTVGWEGFTIRTVTEAGAWSEHCKGTIMLEMKPKPDGFHPNKTTERDRHYAAELQRLSALENEQSKTVDTKAMYGQLRSRGNYYGPLFAQLTQYELGAVDAVSSFFLPDIAESMPEKYLQSHIIHPAPLDTIIQTCIPLFNQSCNVGSIVTAGMERIAISARGLGQPGSEIQIATHLDPLSSLSATANMSAFTADASGETQLAVEIFRAEMRALSSEELDTDEDASTEKAYSLQWAVDANLCRPNTYPFRRPSVSGPDIDVVRRNKMTARYIRYHLGRIPEASVVPSQLFFYRWMQRFSATVEFTAHLDVLDEQVSLPSVDEGAFSHPSDIAVARMCNNLEAIVTGRIEFLSLMMKDDLLFDAYSDEGFQCCYTHLIAFMKSLAFKKPGLRVLEIGAGTGGATSPLLESLTEEWYASIERYDYTDVSAGFLERAKGKFAKYGFMHYNTFDITQDPISQGLQIDFYDVIVASNSIHVCSNMDSALTFARSLLVTGGRLLLIENTVLVPYIGLVFGGLQGWWAGTEDGRPDSPYMPKHDWEARLRRNAFNGIEFCADDFEGESQRTSLIVSKAVSTQTVPDDTLNVSVHFSSRASDGHISAIHLIADTLRDQRLNVSVCEIAQLQFSTRDVHLIIDEKNDPLLANPTEDELKTVTDLLSQTEAKVMWINLSHDRRSHEQHHEHSFAPGLIRTARIENKTLRAVIIDIASERMAGSKCYVLDIRHQLKAFFLAPDGELSSEQDVQFRNGNPWIARLKPDHAVNTALRRSLGHQALTDELFHQDDRPLALAVGRKGILDSLHFVDDSVATGELLPYQVEIRVTACGVNFKDVMVSMGQLSDSTRMAGECSGVITAVGEDFRHKFKAGDRVFSLDATAYASRARVHGSCAFHLPQHMDFVNGASLAVVFLTACYGLLEVARLSEGQTVLIHAAAGGVGQAAIQIAQSVGAEIFVTVGNEAKKDFVVQTYHISDDHVFSSRDGHFKEGVIRMTHERGVDVVLNCLSGELLHLSLDCVAQFGTFVEIGKLDIHARNLLSLQSFDRGLTFTAFDLASLTQHKPALIDSLVSRIRPLFESGTVRPVKPLHVMRIGQIKDAFRKLQGGKVIGKIILQADNEEVVNATPRTYVPPQLPIFGTFVIAGGLGGIGMEVGKFLASRGAKHIALLSRRALPANNRRAIEAEFDSIGARVLLIQADITASDCVETLKSALKDLPPVVGIFQCAMTMCNELVEQMSHGGFQFCVAPKSIGSLNLLEALGSPSLKFCIMLSSLTSLFGGRGVGSYAAGNAFLNSLAVDQPAGRTRFTSVVLGPIQGMGILMRERELQSAVGTAQGYVMLGKAELFAIFDHIFASHAKDETPNMIITGFSPVSLTTSKDVYVFDNPLLKHVLQGKSNNASHSNSAESGELSLQATKTLLLAAQSRAEMQKVVQEQLARKVSTFTSMEPSSFTDETSIVELGLDSLVIIELKNWITRAFQSTISSSEISDAPSLGALASLIVTKSALCQNNGAQEANFETVSSSHPPSSKKEHVPMNKETKTSTLVELPKQPVPDLEGVIRSYVENVEAICSPEEFATTTRAAKDFKTGAGQLLHARATELYEDPAVANWMSTQYTRNAFLKKREPLFDHSTFYGALVLDSDKWSPARVGSVLTAAMLNFKRKLDAGAVASTTLVDRAVDDAGYNSNLFSTSRVPQPDEDQICSYPEQNHVVVLHQGRIFEIDFAPDQDDLKATELEPVFEDVLQPTSSEVVDPSVLTGDGRDEWSETRRDLCSISAKNDESLRAIESAAFVVCFDSDSPSTPQERALQSLFGQNGGNRWYDKSLQLVIFPDGTASILVEHSKIDGVALGVMGEYVLPFLRSELGDERTASQSKPTPLSSGLHTHRELKFETTNAISSSVSVVQASTINFASNYSYDTVQLPLSTQYWRNNAITPATGLQLLVQLANRTYFGHNPPAVNCVSQATFKEGRVALAQTVWPSVVSFCTYASERDAESFRHEPATRSEARKLLASAATALNKATTRASRGLAPTRTLQAFEHLLRPGDPRPALFDDPVYRRHTVEVITTDTLENGLAQCGLAPGTEGAVWVHMQSLQERAVFSIWARKGSDASAWRIHLEKAAVKVQQILEA